MKPRPAAPPATPARPAALPPHRIAALRRAVLGWFDASGRRLPFRGTTDPYAIVVVETMAQQTQIGRVGPAWAGFLERFPTVESLAAAPVADVLRQWRGLGYNSRALNLHRAARVVVAEHAGRFPADVAALERLPGIGPYTARAVAAIAFGLPVGAVDTNVRRVLARVTVGDARGLRPRALQSLADAVVDPSRPADWTHAVMDIGSTFCRTTNPTCGPCPLRGRCAYAAADGATERRDPGSASAPSHGRADRTPFPATTRWLRGRILDRARDAADGTWVRFDDPLGSHPPEAVVAMLAALARDGLLEVAPDDPALARLPHAAVG
ncbi:MAG: hypothetical protein RL338_1067 [Chloroflexota bacterium]